MASMQRLKDWALLILCNLIWASQFVLVKIVQASPSQGAPESANPTPEGMGPIFATFFPMTLAMLILVPIVRRERRMSFKDARAPMAWRDVFDFILIGVLGQVIAQLFATWGSRLTLASNGSLLQLTLPIATTVMAYFLLRERMTWLRTVSFVFAIAGVMVTSFSAPAQSDFSLKSLDIANKDYLLGNLFIFLGVNGSAFYNVFSKRLLKRYTPLEVLLYSYFVVFAFMLPITLWREPSGFTLLPHLRLTQWIAMILLTLFQYSLSMVVFLRVLTRLDATQASVMNYLLPFLGVVIAWMVLGETLTLFMVLGGLLALGSTLLATVFDRPQSAPEDTVEATKTAS